MYIRNEWGCCISSERLLRSQRENRMKPAVWWMISSILGQLYSKLLLRLFPFPSFRITTPCLVTIKEYLSLPLLPPITLHCEDSFRFTWVGSNSWRPTAFEREHWFASWPCYHCCWCFTFITPCIPSTHHEPSKNRSRRNIWWTTRRRRRRLRRLEWIPSFIGYSFSVFFVFFHSYSRTTTTTHIQQSPTTTTTPPTSSIACHQWWRVRQHVS